MSRRFLASKRVGSSTAREAPQNLTHKARAPAAALSDCTFCVVDVETTGLFARGHDRVVEIAVIGVGHSGQVLDEYITLVNPERDIGPTNIHGLTTRDILEAPRFREIAGDLVARLAGRVFVAHNASFDLDFLEAEFAQLGHRLPPPAVVCTMRLASMVESSLPSYRLGALCENYGIPLAGAHSALQDARATAELLRVLLGKARSNGCQVLADLGCEDQPAPAQAWPRLPEHGRVHTRDHASERSQPSRLAQLVDRLPTSSVARDPETLEYVDLLDRVLEDRRATKEEAEALLEVAAQWGLSSPRVEALHRKYFDAVVAAAFEDGIVSEVERRDLAQLAELLGYDPDRVVAAMKEAEAKPRPSDLSSNRPSSSEHSLAGLSVCFTGESQCTLDGYPLSKRQAEQLAAEAGMTVKRNVTKDLDLLVAADPESLSGKAKKARRYGTRIIAEMVFWRMLGVDVQ